jgi:hypothetical protein
MLRAVVRRPLNKIERTLNQDISTWKLLSVLVGGSLIGAMVLFADSPWWDDDHRKFAREGPFVLWAGLMCAQTALWALALVWLAPSVARLRTEYGAKNRTEVVVSTAMILGIIVLLVIGGPVARAWVWPNYLPYHSLKVGLLTLVGALVSLVAARGVWFVHGGLKQLADERLDTRSAMSTFLALQSELYRFLGTLGAILGLLILSTSAQREAVLAYAPKTEYGYELVLVYGFFFSILVASVYLPTYLTLVHVGTGIRDAYFPQVLPSSPDWEGRTAKREKLGSLLELQTGPLGRFKASVAILTPFIGSLVGLLLK